jgi:DNA-binding transcriptional ArsR family regulator
VARLCDRGPMSTTGLARGSGVTRQAVAKHLRVMERARLVHGTRRGRERVWDLDDRQLREARHYLEAISKQWDAALERLRKFVEN